MRTVMAYERARPNQQVSPEAASENVPPAVVTRREERRRGCLGTSETREALDSAQMPRSAATHLRIVLILSNQLSQFPLSFDPFSPANLSKYSSFP